MLISRLLQVSAHLKAEIAIYLRRLCLAPRAASPPGTPGRFTAPHHGPGCQAPRASPPRITARGATFTVKPGVGLTPYRARATV